MWSQRTQRDAEMMQIQYSSMKLSKSLKIFFQYSNQWKNLWYLLKLYLIPIIYTLSMNLKTLVQSVIN